MFDAESIALGFVLCGMGLWLAHHATGYAPLIYAAFLAMVVAIATVVSAVAADRLASTKPRG